MRDLNRLVATLMLPCAFMSLLLIGGAPASAHDHDEARLVEPNPTEELRQEAPGEADGDDVHRPPQAEASETPEPPEPVTEPTEAADASENPSTLEPAEKTSGTALRESPEPFVTMLDAADAVVEVRVGAVAENDDSVALAGAQLALFPGLDADEPLNADWATCTSDAGGICVFTVPQTGAGGENRDAELYISAWDAPEGYQTADTARFRVGERGPDGSWQLRAGETYRFFDHAGQPSAFMKAADVAEGRGPSGIYLFAHENRQNPDDSETAVERVESEEGEPVIQSDETDEEAAVEPLVDSDQLQPVTVDGAPDLVAVDHEEVDSEEFEDANATEVPAEEPETDRTSSYDPPLTTLPHTGGSGQVIYLITGAVLIALALAAVTWSRAARS